MNNGGPAFPCVWENTTGENAFSPRNHVAPPGGTDSMPGMSLRDWFAGMALGVRINYGANVRANELAEECYKIADAMLAERRQTND